MHNLEFTALRVGNRVFYAMTNYLEAKIADLAAQNKDFKSLTRELCDGVNWDPAEYSGQSLATLLVRIVQEDKALTIQHVAVPRILATRVDKLIYGSVIYCVCDELLKPTNKRIEAFGRRNVLAVIKERCRFLRSTLLRQRKPRKSQFKHHHTTDLIKRARESRGIWG